MSGIDDCSESRFKGPKKDAIGNGRGINNKPILIATTLGSAEDAATAVTTTADAATYFAVAAGCGFYLSLIGKKWIRGGTLSTLAAETADAAAILCLIVQSASVLLTLPTT